MSFLALPATALASRESVMDARCGLSTPGYWDGHDGAWVCDKQKGGLYREEGSSRDHVPRRERFLVNSLHRP